MVLCLGDNPWGDVVANGNSKRKSMDGDTAGEVTSYYCQQIKRWWNFDKKKTYTIPGFAHLDFFPNQDGRIPKVGWNLRLVNEGFELKRQELTPNPAHCDPGFPLGYHHFDSGGLGPQWKPCNGAGPPQWGFSGLSPRGNPRRATPALSQFSVTEFGCCLHIWPLRVFSDLCKVDLGFLWHKI